MSTTLFERRRAPWIGVEDTWLYAARDATPQAGPEELTIGLARRAIESVLDRLADGVLVASDGGTELHRNPALERMFAADPEQAAILAAADALAKRAAMPQRRDRSAPGGPPPPAKCTVATTAASYALGLSHLPPGTFARGWTVIVTIARSTPAPPSSAELRDRLGLTRREADVALLLAYGASDRAAGDQLGISPHTVRKHAEHIFDKLGLHSRKAFLVELTRTTRNG